MLLVLHQQEYQKALEDADEKVQLANQMYELVSSWVNISFYTCYIRDFFIVIVGLLNEVRICELQISSSNSYSFFSPSIFESKHH